MPYYDYECPRCKAVITVLAKITDPPVINCPILDCQHVDKKGFKKLLSTANFKFVGEGFDYTRGKKEREKKQALKELNKRE